MDRFIAYPDPASDYTLVIDTVHARIVALYPDARAAERAVQGMNEARDEMRSDVCTSSAFSAGP